MLRECGICVLLAGYEGERDVLCDVVDKRCQRDRRRISHDRVVDRDLRTVHVQLMSGEAVVLPNERVIGRAPALLLDDDQIPAVNGWRERATASPYYSALWTEGWVNWSLWIHLTFAVSTSLLWIFVIVQALRKFPRPPLPNEYGPRHKFWATIAAVDLCLTALTGWTFYCPPSKMAPESINTFPPTPPSGGGVDVLIPVIKATEPSRSILTSPPVV